MDTEVQNTHTHTHKKKEQNKDFLTDSQPGYVLSMFLESGQNLSFNVLIKKVLIKKKKKKKSVCE